MNWTIEHIDEESYVRVESEGYFAEADNQALLKDLIYQSFWKPSVNVLFDNRQRKYGDDGLAHMRKISQHFLDHDAFIGCGKIAFLMKSVRDFNLGREFKLLTDEDLCADVRIFLNEAFAVGWVKKH